MKPLTRLSTTVASSRNLNHWLRHGLTAMLSQPSGPVHLSLTHDTLTGDCAAEYMPVSDFSPARAAEPTGGRDALDVLEAQSASPYWPAPASSTIQPPAN